MSKSISECIVEAFLGSTVPQDEERPVLRGHALYRGSPAGEWCEVTMDTYELLAEGMEDGESLVIVEAEL